MWLNTAEEARAVGQELKTPFNGVLGMAATLSSFPVMCHVQKAASRLLEYIDKAFDLTLMTQGSLITPWISVDVHVLLEEVVNLISVNKIELESTSGLILLGNECSLVFVFYVLGFAALSTARPYLKAERRGDKIVITSSKSEISAIDQRVLADIFAFHGGIFGSCDGLWMGTIAVKGAKVTEMRRGVFGFFPTSDLTLNLAHSLALVALYLKYPFRCIQNLSLGETSETQKKQLSVIQRCAGRVVAFAEEVEDAMLFGEQSPVRGTVAVQQIVAEVIETLQGAKHKRTQQPLKKDEVLLLNEVNSNLPDIDG
jgi:hypothetical protein